MFRSIFDLCMRLTPLWHEEAGAQPLISAAELRQWFADTGVLLGYCGLVERLVADAIANSRGPATVVVTGGNAERLLRHTRLRVQHTPDLVHRGLLCLAD